MGASHKRRQMLPAFSKSSVKSCRGIVSRRSICISAMAATRGSESTLRMMLLGIHGMSAVDLFSVG